MISSAPALAMKLLSRAIDPNAPQPEAETSAAKFVQHCRREGVTLIDLAKSLAVVLPRDVPEKPIEPEPMPLDCRRTMPFGKYKGMTLSVIASRNPDYLPWLLDNLDLYPDLLRAVETTCNYYELQQGEPA